MVNQEDPTDVLIVNITVTHFILYDAHRQPYS